MQVFKCDIVSVFWYSVAESFSTESLLHKISCSLECWLKIIISQFVNLSITSAYLYAF